MREINIGEQTLRVRATPLALLFYRQEFKTDLIGDLTKLERVKDDLSQLDTVAMLQLVWAMAKADAFGKPFPGFVDWVASLEGFDFSDPGFMTAALEEAASGFFRSAAQKQAASGKQRK